MIPLEHVDTDLSRRTRELAPLRQRLQEIGASWGTVRRWALTEVAAGRRAWTAADLSPYAARPLVIEAYLDYLDAGEGA